MSHKSIGVGRKGQPAKTKVLGGAGKLVLKPHPSEHSAMKSLLKPKNEKECSVERESKPSVQAKTSGSKMELRKNRKRNRKYSSDEATSDENDESDEESMTLVVDGQNVQEMSRGWTALGPRRRPSQKQSILHLYEEMQPCTPKEASKLLDVPASKLEGWVNQSKKKRQKKGEPSIVFQMESNDIDTYIDSNTGAQYIVVEDSGDEARDVDASKTEVWLERPELENSKKPNLLRKLVNVQDDNSGLPQCSNIVQEINDSNFVIIADTDRKNNLREKIEIFRKFDDMKPCSRKLAAETFGMSAHAFSCLLNKRVYLEKKYKKKVLEEVALLRMYDRLQCKNDAHTILGLSVDELRNLLRCRTELENECRKHLSAKERLEGRIVDEVDGRLGNELFAWYQSQQREGKGLTWKQLKSRAHDLAQSLDLVAFAPTDKWLMDWQKSLSSREKANKLPERAKTVYKSDFLIYDLKDASTNLLSALKHFHPDDIFNLCETGLYYRLVPGQSRLRDDWITVLFACNMSGTEKKQLLVSGKSKSPLCFNVLPLPLTYVQNGEACVTKEMVSNYLRSWSNELALSRRNVAVILEECSSHSNLNFDYIQFYYTANSSPDMPLRRGIITQTKSAYRQNMASTLLKFDSSHLDEELPKNISIVDALFMLAECWDSVPKSTLIAAFSTAFPLGHANLEEDNTLFEDDDVAKLNELDDEIRVHLDGPPPRIRALGDDTAANVSYDSPTSSDDEQNIVGEMVVHAEGTVSIGDENIEEFDIDTLMCTSSSSPRKINDVEIISSKNEIVASRKKPAISGLRSILAAAQKSEESPPSVNDVKAALSTIKRFLQSNGGTLEDLTDYTQLETKVLSKLPAWCVG